MTEELIQKKWDNVEDLSEYKKELDGKYESGLPEYLAKYFDQEEKKILQREYFINLARERARRLVETTPEERKEYIESEVVKFWENNRAQLVKKQRRLGSHLEPVYEEPITVEVASDPEEQMGAEEVRALVHLSEEDLYLFAVRYFSHYLRRTSSKLHRFIYKTLTREVNRKNRKKGFKIAIAAPRGGAKSSLISIIFPIWCICYNKKKFIILVSETASAAEEFLEDVKRELLHNEKLKRDFPRVVGPGPTWKKGEIITPNNIKMLSLGRGNQIRGKNFGSYRPDLVCHEKGTLILYNNNWIKIEQHPSALEKVDDGFEIKSHGLPFSEIVTKEHKYWVKTIEKSSLDQKSYEIDTNWVEAKDLLNTYKTRHYIGYKIDTEVGEVQPIPVYSPDIVERDQKGRIIKSSSAFRDEIPQEFYDKDFWWFIGLWWGDGYSSGKHLMNISFNKNDKETIEKFLNILNKYNVKVHIQKDHGNFLQLSFCWSKFARWLKSWRIGNSRKCPPMWVEKMSLEYQKELIKGYVAADGFVDYGHREVRLTSIHLLGLLCVRRILMRLGIPSSIRKGIEGQENFIILGNKCTTQTKYDLRFQDNAQILEYNIPDKSRYKYTRIFIKDGYLWSKFHIKTPVFERVFIPITMENHQYTTHYGISHNCMDDIEDSESVRSKTTREFIRYVWFNKDALRVEGEEGTITDFLFIGTILGKDSLLEALLTPEEYPDWLGYRFKAVEKFSTSDLWLEWEKLLKNRFDEDRKITARNFFEDHKEEMLDGTQVLWPEGDPYYNLMVIKASDPSGFSSEKMNDPLDPTKILVKESDLHFENFNMTPYIKRILKMSSFIGAFDPSVGKKKDADYSVLVSGVRDRKSGYIYITDINIRRRSVDEQIDDIIKEFERLRHKYIVFETNGFQIVIADNLKKKSREMGLHIPVKDVANYSDKHMRIQSIVPLIKDGTIVFDKHKREYNQQYALAIDQILTYSENASNDDAFDALEMLIREFRGNRFKMLVKSAS
uniref:Putative homing endonuclease n=2 Tax=viral metagenome TaxID=1070528 RepID=A0A6M3KDB0_9ZZZZ